jgi:hypothetical protein
MKVSWTRTAIFPAAVETRFVKGQVKVPAFREQQVAGYGCKSVVLTHSTDALSSFAGSTTVQRNDWAKAGLAEPHVVRSHLTVSWVTRCGSSDQDEGSRLYSKGPRLDSQNLSKFFG